MTHKTLRHLGILLAVTLAIVYSVNLLQAQKTTDTNTRKIDFRNNITLAASANLDQCRNGTEAVPLGCAAADQWVNGNANHVNAHWSETEFIAYRMSFSGLTLAQHEVILGYDILKGTQHAIDYLGMYSTTETTADPCAGLTMCSDAPMTFPVPEDTVTVTNNINPNTGLPIDQTAGVFTMWGGTIVDVQYMSYTGGEERQIKVTFTASRPDPLLAWGGHIAWIGDWGAGNSAVTINGSPYHMRLISLDGSGGNQDRALDSGAVIPSGVVNIKKEVFTAPPDPTNGAFTTFNFMSSTNFGATSFGLIDDNEGPGIDTKQSMAITSFGPINTITVTEQATYGWTLLNVNCVEDGKQNSTKNAALPTASIIVESGETVTCTYQNSQLAPTAAEATVSGQVTNGYHGMYGVVVSLTAPKNGAVVYTRTNSFGYFQFTSVPTGQVYIVEPRLKGLVFVPGSRMITVTDDIANLDFVGSPQ